MQVSKIIDTSDRSVPSLTKIKGQWAFLEKSGDREDFSNGVDFEEINGIVPGGLDGAEFTDSTTAALYIPPSSSTIPTSGFGIAIVFTAKTPSDTNGQSLAKLWTMSSSEAAIVGGVVSAVLSIQLEAVTNKPYFLVTHAGSFGARTEVKIDTETMEVTPGVTYFLFANCGGGKLSLTIGALQGELVKEEVNWTNTIPVKNLPFVIGLQEVGRTPDPEPPYANIHRVGVYENLTDNEITQIAYEYGVFGGFASGDVVTGYAKLNEHEIKFPMINGVVAPSADEIALFKTNHDAVVKSFIVNGNDLLAADSNLRVKRLVAGSWNVVTMTDVRNTAGDTNHSVLSYKDGDLSKPMITMLAATVSTNIDYDDPNSYSGRFAIEAL